MEWQEANNKITKTYKLKDFKEALNLANKIGELAEEEGHHPDILISYGKLEVSLTSHDEGKVTDKDVSLSQKIDQIS